MIESEVGFRTYSAAGEPCLASELDNEGVATFSNRRQRLLEGCGFGTRRGRLATGCGEANEEGSNEDPGGHTWDTDGTLSQQSHDAEDQPRPTWGPPP